MTTDVRRQRTRRRCKIDGRWPGQSDWQAFGLYGVKYRDAMKAAAEMRRDTARRLEEIDRFLALSEEEYTRVAPDRSCQPSKDLLQEIREWFSGELEMACRVLALDADEVGETAAINEYDHGFSRRQSEINALKLYLQRARRYDEKVRELVEDGLILDISRRFLDDMAAAKEAEK